MPTVAGSVAASPEAPPISPRATPVIKQSTSSAPERCSILPPGLFTGLQDKAREWTASRVKISYHVESCHVYASL